MPDADKRCRGQAGLETIAIFAGILVVLMVILLVLPNSIQSGEVLRQEQTAKRTVQAAATAADNVYLSGEGASQTVWLEIPDIWDPARSFIGNQTNTTGWSDRKLISIYVRSTGDVFGVSRAPVCGAWPAKSGKYMVNFTYNGTANRTVPAHVMVNGESC
ncbi:Uncharacterised protein [uncultured archaeon]|nr:Uncharacterised protein [uncultured archaeon]